MGELTLIYDSISVAELSVPRSDDTLVGLNLSFTKLFLGCQGKLADRSKLLNKMYDSFETFPKSQTKQKHDKFGPVKCM